MIKEATTRASLGMTGAFKSERHSIYPRRAWLILFFSLATGFLAAQNPKPADASLHGTVRDSSGSPIPGVRLLFQKKSDPKGLTITADDHGNYSFTGLAAGEYYLHAIVGGYTDNGSAPLVIKEHESKTWNLVLTKDPITAPEFFDKPQFTVSGVVDTTALGGHGSDTVVRARESIAKDTAKLSNAAAAPTAMPSDIEDLLRSGKYNEARERVRSLIASGDKAELHHLLADIDEKAGDPLEAVREYQRAAEMTSSEPYIFDWGSELLLHHAPEPAEQVFANGNHLFPSSVRMLVGLGAANFGAGRYEDAVKKVCEASDLSPNDSAPYLFLGKMQSAENVFSPELLDHLRRFATTQPQNAQANYYYATALWKQSRGQQTSGSEIESLLEKAISLDPNYAPAELQLGIVKSERGDSSAAVNHLTRAIQLNPQSDEAHFRLSQAYRKLGETDKSKQELQTYKELSKKSAEQIDRERREIPQFVYTLRAQPASPTP